MLRAIQQNSLSLLISVAGIAGYATWIALPETTTVQDIYERYIATEESRPRSFEEGVSIRLDREAPPVAALEEALRDQPWTTIERNPSATVPATELKLVVGAAEKMARKILSENATAQAAIEIALRNRAVAAVPAPVQVLAPQAVAIVPQAVRPAVQQQPVQQAPREISQSKTGLTREEILAALFGPISTSSQKPSHTVQASRGPTIWMPAQASNAPASRSNNTASKAGRGNAQADSSFGYSDIVDRAAAFVSGNGANAKSETPSAPRGRQILIRGPIEFAGGLALTDPRDRLVVLRESRGQFVESGAVWIREARYEIFVESLEGALVAEVRAPHGEVIGRGHLDLGRVNVTAEQKRVDGVALKVNPIVSGFAGTTYSPYSNAPSKGVQGARVEVGQSPIATKSVSGGHFEEPRMSEGSRVMARVRARDHWTTVAMLTTGHESMVPVYSGKMMNAFVGLTSKDSNEAAIVAKSLGVVWGKVTRSGQPAAGARVEALTEGMGEPVYFNEFMLPDPAMKETGSNGLFAIPRASIGAHFVQVKVGHRASDPVLLATEAGAVSSLELDLLKMSEIPAHVFDAFRPDLMLRAEVQPTGHPKSRTMVVDETDGQEARVRLAHVGQPISLEINAGSEYVAARVIQNPDTRHLSAPMVRREWMDRVAGQLRYNGSGTVGHVVGFINGSRFRVSVDGESLSNEAKIAYFDARGELTSREFGEAGGGFVLFGVKDGLRTIVVETENSERVFVATVLVDGGVVSTFSHWLR